jgi:2',3'-cyclic-nucleotide 2'-phosphodiesterase (5'-nucleotidase family)
LDLWIDKETKQIAGYEGQLIDLLSEEIEHDTAMLAIISKWEKITQKGFDEVIGYSNEELVRTGFEESAIGNLITDAMREFFDVDVAIHNSGGIRANLPKGEVTYRDCFNIDALSNTAVIMEMTGQQIFDALEIGVNGHHAIFQVSGLKFRYDSEKPIGSRLLAATLADGTPIDTSKYYSLVTNSFLAAGGGEYTIFKEGRNAQDSFTYLRNIIVEYVKKHSPIDKGIEGRIIDVARR